MAIRTEPGLQPKLASTVLGLPKSRVCTRTVIISVPEALHECQLLTPAGCAHTKRCIMKDVKPTYFTQLQPRTKTSLVNI